MIFKNIEVTQVHQCEPDKEGLRAKPAPPTFGIILTEPRKS